MGQVWSRSGKRLGFYEYNGTSDIVLTAVRETAAEVMEHWRTDAADAECVAPVEHVQEPVVLYTNYADGSYWPGAWCPICRCITDGIILWDVADEDEHEGHPFPRLAAEP